MSIKETEEATYTATPKIPKDQQQIYDWGFQAGRDSMREESLIEVEFYDGSKKKVEPKEAIELIKKDIEELRSNFK